MIALEPLPALFDEAIQSFGRTVANARPDDRLAIFSMVIREAGKWPVRNGIDKALLVDWLRHLADSAGLVEFHGEDGVQSAIASAFIGQSNTPPDGEDHSNAATAVAYYPHDFPPPSEPPAPKFRLVPFDELRPGKEPACLVKELIPRVGLTVAWGPRPSLQSWSATP